MSYLFIDQGIFISSISPQLFKAIENKGKTFIYSILKSIKDIVQQGVLMEYNK